MSDSHNEKGQFELDRERLEFEREKWRDEAAFRTVGAGSALGGPALLLLLFLRPHWQGVGNIVFAYINGIQQRELERGKSEAQLILEMIKTANPDSAAVNLGFLVDFGLLSDDAQVKRIHNYLKARPEGKGPSLPANASTKEYDDALKALKGKIKEFNDKMDSNIAAYTEGIKANPSASAYMARGLRYAYKNEFDHAIEDFSQAINPNPKSASSYINRGTAYLKKHDFDRAIADYSQAIKLDREPVLALANRASAFTVKHDFEHAIADYGEVIKLDPQPVRYNQRGLVYLDTGDFNRGKADFEKAISLNIKFAEAHV